MAFYGAGEEVKGKQLCYVHMYVIELLLCDQVVLYC